MNLQEEAARCLICKKPHCSASCPVATPIPQVIQLFLAGEEQEAGRILFENNPLSAICSVVCPHERNCCGHCVRGLKSQPVKFYEIEQYISEKYLESYQPPQIEKNGFRVAVIGAGPAGITVSILLARRGFNITLIEAREQVGGVLRYGIPDFRLPRRRIDLLDEALYRLGVRFKPNTFVGATVTMEDMLFVDGYDAAFISVGTAKPNRLGLRGETLGNVHFAVDFLHSPASYRLGHRVAVIGAGNVAMDAARMAVRHLPADGQVVILNSRRECDMPGNPLEIADAKAEGVTFQHLQQAIQLTEEGVKCAAVLPLEQPDGSILYEEDFSAVSLIPADTIILAIGQGPQAAVIADTNVSRTIRGLLAADESGRTSMPGVFAAGDVVSGPKTVVEAVAHAKRAADEIEAYCRAKASAQ